MLPMTIKYTKEDLFWVACKSPIGADCILRNPRTCRRPSRGTAEWVNGATQSASICEEKMARWID